jgi:hypothetical protein
MSAPSIDIKDMLAAESSLALTFAVDLFVGLEPDKPVDCVTIYDTPGGPPQLNMNAAEEYEYKSAQVRIRDQDYETGWNLANEIKTSLHGRAGETWNGTLYTVIAVSNGPFFLKWDENHRAIFIINLNLQRR